MFSSSMSILVNGSTTMDLQVEKWLRQSDPLLSFLFVIAMEGLTRLMKKVVVLNEFSGFLVSDDVSFDILQFVDDTIIFGEGSWSNLWSIKVVLREFELVSGLCIKLRKSNIFGVNVDTHFIQCASSFLHCYIGNLPFKSLGVQIGSSPRRLVIWMDLIDLVRNKLCSWKGKLLSLGGRVVLINAVLNTILIYTLSFCKAPKKVLKEIFKIQSNFLWSGTEQRKSIHWVNWTKVCASKNKDGIGIKNIEVFNISLLLKWK